MGGWVRGVRGTGRERAAARGAVAAAHETDGLAGGEGGEGGEGSEGSEGGQSSEGGAAGASGAAWRGDGRELR